MVENTMSDQEKSKAELIEELAAARQRIKELETIEDELHLICEVLANAAGQIFWAMTPDFSRMSIINPVACDISGYPHEEFVINPKRWFELVHPDDLQGLNEAIEAHEKNGRRETQYRIIRADGEIRWILDQATTIYNKQGEPIAQAGIASDITERKEAEEFARRQRDLAVATSGASELDDALEHCMNLSMESTGADRAGIYIVNTDGSLDLIAHQGLSDKFSDVVSYYPSDSPQAEVVRKGRCYYASAGLTEENIREHCRIEGLTFVAAIPILYGNQPVACMNVGFSDIAEISETARDRLEAIAANLGGMIVRLEAERRHHDSESSMRAMLDAISESAFLVSTDEHVVLVANETAAKRFGATVEELVGQPVGDFVSEKHRLERKAWANEVTRTGKPVYEVDNRDGMILESTIYPVFDDSNEVAALAIFAKDVTEQQQAAEKIAIEQRLLRELLNLQERERMLVSHEIHDGVVQDIVAAKMFLNAACVKARAVDYEPPIEVCKVEEYLANAITEARRLIRELRPMIIEEEGVVRSIDFLVTQERESTDIRIEFRHEVEFDRIDPMVEGNIYRIVHEAVRNARRYSHGNKIEVSLVQNDGHLMIGVVDDGIGFDPNKISEDRFGVRGIRERARLFGGNACIESAENEGTKILVQLPIELTAEMIVGDQKNDSSFK